MREGRSKQRKGGEAWEAAAQLCIISHEGVRLVGSHAGNRDVVGRRCVVGQRGTVIGAGKKRGEGEAGKAGAGERRGAEGGWQGGGGHLV